LIRAFDPIMGVAFMKKQIFVGMIALLTLGAVPEAAQAQPGGCLKYGAGGAVAGHFAGGHRWKGAAAGCALGYFRRKQWERQQVQRQRFDRDRYERRRYDEPPVARRQQREWDPNETGSIRRPQRDFESEGNFSEGSFLRRDRAY
jgi:hypothetical protein